MKTILHLDMNSYFATAEQQANPALRGRPVGIIKARDRGCVIAASIEAKKWGVKTGSTVWEAKRLCPQIILVPSDMEKYFSLTERMIQIMNDYSPTVEIFSIDECFADITDSQKLFAGGMVEMALEIKQRVKLDLGEWMKCSIGVSFSKLTAKLASEMKKPDGLVILTPENYVSETNEAKIEDVCGIGYARTKYLHSRGAYTLGQARCLPHMPPEIDELVWLRLDEPLTTIADLVRAKSVSRTYTTFARLDAQALILKLVRNLTEEATSKLREMKMAGRTFCLSLSSKENFFWARKTVKSATDDPLVIYNALAAEYERRPIIGIRQAGVWISNLAFSVQRSFFERREEFLRAADAVNNKHGLFTVYPASLLGGELIRPEVTGYLGDKWYRFAKKD